MTDYRNIPQSIRNSDKWVCTRSGRKMPLRADMLVVASIAPMGYVTGTMLCASSVNPDTWCSFEEAYNVYTSNLCSHIGYVFDGDGVIGIDLDHCFEDGLINDRSMEIIRAFNSYTEISKSGEGIHILVKGKLPFKGANNRNGCEVYGTGRFFVLTGDRIYGSEIVENQEAIDWLLGKYFSDDIPTLSADGIAYTPKPSLWKTDVTISDDFHISVKHPEIKQGNRNCMLLSYGGTLIGKGLSKEEIAEKIKDMNTRKCVPPLPKDEETNIIKSVLKYYRKGETDA